MTRREFTGSVLFGIAGTARLLADELPRLNAFTAASNPNDKIGACGWAVGWGEFGEGQATALMVPLPESADEETFLEIDGRLARINFKGPFQINFHVDCTLQPGTYDAYVIHKGQRSDVHPITISSSGPGIFSLDPRFGNNIPAAVINPNATRPNGAILGLDNTVGNVTTSPIRPGEIVLYYTTGAPTRPELKPGEPAPQAYDITSEVEVLFDGQPLQFSHPGEHFVWHPAFVGLQQGGFYIPETTQTGMKSLEFRPLADNNQSTRVYIPVSDGSRYLSGTITITDGKTTTPIPFDVKAIHPNNRTESNVQASPNLDYIVNIPRPRPAKVIVEVSDPTSVHHTFRGEVATDGFGNAYSVPTTAPYVVFSDSHFRFVENPTINYPNPVDNFFRKVDDPNVVLTGWEVLYFTYFSSGGLAIQRFNHPEFSKRPPGPIYVFLDLDNAPKEARRGIEERLHWWNLDTNRPQFVNANYDVVKQHTGISVRWVQNGRAFMKHYFEPDGEYVAAEINLDPTFPVEDLIDFFLHELGHTVLPHIPEQRAVMHRFLARQVRGSGEPPLLPEIQTFDMHVGLPYRFDIKQLSDPPDPALAIQRAKSKMCAQGSYQSISIPEHSPACSGCFIDPVAARIFFGSIHNLPPGYRLDHRR